MGRVINIQGKLICPYNTYGISVSKAFGEFQKQKEANHKFLWVTRVLPWDEAGYVEEAKSYNRSMWF